MTVSTFWCLLFSRAKWTFFKNSVWHHRPSKVGRVERVVYVTTRRVALFLFATWRLFNVRVTSLTGATIAGGSGWVGGQNCQFKREQRNLSNQLSDFERSPNCAKITISPGSKFSCRKCLLQVSFLKPNLCFLWRRVWSVEDKFALRRIHHWLCTSQNAAHFHLEWYSSVVWGLRNHLLAEFSFCLMRELWCWIRRILFVVLLEVHGGALEICKAFLAPKSIQNFVASEVDLLKRVLGQFVSVCEDGLEMNRKLASAFPQVLLCSLGWGFLVPKGCSLV